MSAILQLKDIRLSFTNTHNETFNLLNGVSLDVEEGKITALVGGNGSGKTTLFNIISGFQKGYKGDVVFEGYNFNRIPAHHISLMGIGRMFQGGQLLAGLTLMENMKVASNNRRGETPFSSLIYPRRCREAECLKEEQAREILVHIFGEGNKYLSMLNEESSSFSYGEQRLLSLAAMLMGDDRLLLLDEPTSGVNPVHIDTIENIIREMVAGGITILLIEHNMRFVRRVADTCAYLDDGVIAKVGPTAEVLDDENVRNSYLGL
ncbi:MAG: ABC transporter ATP-binding protein [Bacteroidales bacterium]|nr:ABC transporter ATP-binding protein [Bacteroidales bacterium]